jgi:hypothetical protein
VTTFNQAANKSDPTVTTGLTELRALTFDASGNLYVGTCISDGGSGSVALFTSASLSTFGDGTHPAFNNTTTGCAWGVKVTLK